jgi:DNA-binding transcriptional LysR family regulator
MSASELVSNASQLGPGQAGRLAVGCYSTLAPIMMPRVTAGLAEHHPGIELDFMEGSHAFLERTLREGSCEIAVLYNYEFHRGRVPEDFTVHVVAAVPPHLVLPAGHRLARRDAVHLEEVLAETLILFDLEPGGEYFLGIFHQLASRRRSGCGQRAMKWCGSWSLVAWVTPCSPRRPRSRPPTNGTPSSPYR